jgi:hypothetical protein
MCLCGAKNAAQTPRACLDTLLLLPPGDPELCQHVTFARVNIDRVKPLVRQLGITKIPTVLLLGPDGKTLDSFRASGQAARDALQLQLAAMKQQQLLLLAAPGLGQGRGPEEQLAASEGGEDDSSGSRGSNVSNGPDASTVTGSNSSSGGGGSSGSGVTCGTSPEPACGNLPPGIQPADTPAVPSSTAASAANSSSSSSGPQAPVDAGLAAAKQQFMQQYGSGYGYGGWLEQHYQQEVGERLGPGKHYLDYTGDARVWGCQLRAPLRLDWPCTQAVLLCVALQARSRDIRRYCLKCGHMRHVAQQVLKFALHGVHILILMWLAPRPCF